MQISYHSEFKTADEMIKQTAYSNMPDIDKEIIYLKDTDTNDIGDHIIPCLLYTSFHSLSHVQTMLNL